MLKTVDNAHTREIRTVAHSPNGNLIASGSDDKTIKIWDAFTLGLKFAIDDAHSSPVSDLSFTGFISPHLISVGKNIKVLRI